MQSNVSSAPQRDVESYGATSPSGGTRAAAPGAPRPGGSTPAQKWVMAGCCVVLLAGAAFFGYQMS